MDEDLLADLKQFITATVSQQTSELSAEISRVDEKLSNEISRINGKLSAEISRVDEKLDQIAGSIADALDATHQTTDEQLRGHEHRIARLEHKTA